MADYYPTDRPRRAGPLGSGRPACGAVYDRAARGPEWISCARLRSAPVRRGLIPDREGAALERRHHAGEADYAPPAAAPLPAAHGRSRNRIPKRSPFDNEEPYAERGALSPGPERLSRGGAPARPASPFSSPIPEGGGPSRSPEPRLAAAGVALAKPSADARRGGGAASFSPFTVPPRAAASRPTTTSSTAAPRSASPTAAGARCAEAHGRLMTPPLTPPDTRAASGGERTGSDRTGRETTQPPGARARPRIDPKTERTGGGRARDRESFAGALAAVIRRDRRDRAGRCGTNPVDLVAQAPTAAVESPRTPSRTARVVRAHRWRARARGAAGAARPAGSRARPRPPPCRRWGAGEGTRRRASARCSTRRIRSIPQGQPRAGARPRRVAARSPVARASRWCAPRSRYRSRKLRLVLADPAQSRPDAAGVAHESMLTFETGTLESRRVRDIRGCLQLKDEEDDPRRAGSPACPCRCATNLFLDRPVEPAAGHRAQTRPCSPSATGSTCRIRLASGQRATPLLREGTSGDRILDEAFLSCVFNIPRDLGSDRVQTSGETERRRPRQPAIPAPRAPAPRTTAAIETSTEAAEHTGPGEPERAALPEGLRRRARRAEKVVKSRRAWPVMRNKPAPSRPAAASPRARATPHARSLKQPATFTASVPQGGRAGPKCPAAAGEADEHSAGRRQRPAPRKTVRADKGGVLGRVVEPGWAVLPVSPRANGPAVNVAVRGGRPIRRPRA